MTDDQLVHIFQLMDSQRHLPNYKLELRAAPFFEFFLPDILYRSLKGHPRIDESAVIPEFPLDDKSRHKVDYVVFGEKEKPSGKLTPYFVELKTDMEYFLPTQIVDYAKRAKDDFACMMEKNVIGRVKRTDTTPRRQKYAHLLRRLTSPPGPDIVTLPQKDIFETTFPPNKKGWSNARRNVKVNNEIKFAPIEVVVLLPKKEHPKVDKLKGELKHINATVHFIDFCEVANLVETRGGLGCIFATYLRKWTKRAGIAQIVWQ